MTGTKPSKSAKKRALNALQELGERLIQLNDAQLAAIDLDLQLLEAVQAAQMMRSHGALRRQKQLIGKIMRGVDPAPIQSALDSFAQQGRAAQTLFRKSEAWRDRIAADGPDALAEFFVEIGCHNDQLEQALREYGAARDAQKKKHIKRRIFREVHGELAIMLQKARR